MQTHNRFGFTVLGAVALAIAGCGHSAVHPMPIASDAGAKAVAEYDANKDGALSYEELRGAPGLRAAVAKIKKLAKPGSPAPSENELWNVKITADEIDDRIKDWKASGAGRVLVQCRVTRKGEPLGNAEVKFVPEDFLGPGLTMGSGTTDGGGHARISQPGGGPGNTPLGMSPGFYRVEITKGDEIPAKYNTTTMLGQEVARDASGISGTLQFELDY